MIEKNHPSNLQHLADDALNEYLDGYLDPNETAFFETHLESCAACAARLKGLQTVYNSLESLADIPLTRDLSLPVVSAIQPKVVLSQRLKWGVLTQTVLTLVMLSLAVPSLLKTWQPILYEILYTLNTHFSNTLLTWTADWNTQRVGWQLSLTNLLSEWQPPSIVATTQIFVWPIFLAAILLFIIGNGLVLRRITHNDVQ